MSTRPVRTPRISVLHRHCCAAVVAVRPLVMLYNFVDEGHMVWPFMRYAEVAPTSARQEKKTPAHDQRLRSQKTSIVTSPCTSDSGATSMDCPSRLHGASTRSNDHRNRKAQHRSGLHTSHDDGASDDHATCVCVHASHDGDAASLRRLCLREPALRSLQEKQRQAVREPPVRRSQTGG